MILPHAEAQRRRDAESKKARGKSEEGLGEFTFLYTDWFYCVHLLNVSIS